MSNLFFGKYFPIFFVITIYLMTNIMLFSTIHQIGDGLKCNKDFNRRIEYVFWGNALGCWLFEDLSEKDKDKGGG